ncbi:serine O-acetyltransferase EpsC [Pollutimonas thiosulfatoxidans]|uniref:serine O-acetyltransferase n=1 Tax=Pollutimonas thiosulfatoxidans TaxID=2028345 RepID=A0A410G9Z1_9BURK|nr:serine O-acetyltransferase EpsC [Pollutimonas thiosulfatoxidans]MBF6617929.1 serine acetyltransferase [Candidimonas sp.]NYT44945.1 serine acetyltransferase [Alcaligenaceae bacterium]QAA93129.1 serine acetyltransferase [Pollutimonas thiosulfatoxidans]
MAVFEINSIVDSLKSARQDWRASQHRSREPGGREFPSPQAIAGILEDLKGVLFPMRLGPLCLRQESEDFYIGHTLDSALHALLGQVRLELQYELREHKLSSNDIEQKAVACVQSFANALPEIRRMLDADVLAAYQGDPAARSVDEVLLCYPGVLAMIHHRIAHQFYNQDLHLLARMSSELAHSQTGIDIHPGAQIGPSFFIDHGTGVVIGETAIIGKGVRIYQAVTLGAKRFPTDANGKIEKGLPRHPIVEDDVVIYAGATILGRVTLGRGCTIGGNVWLINDVPAGGHVTQADSQGMGTCDPAAAVAGA